MLVSLVLGLGLEHSCPWPRECLFSERLSLALASDLFCVLGLGLGFFCVLGLGLEPCVLDSTSGKRFTRTIRLRIYTAEIEISANCNYFNYILFTKLPQPRDSEETFRSSSQVATSQNVLHTWWRLHNVLLIAERQVRKLEYQFI